MNESIYATNINENRSPKKNILLTCPKIILGKYRNLKLNSDIFNIYINKSKKNEKNSKITIGQTEKNSIINNRIYFTEEGAIKKNNKIFLINSDLINTNVSTMQSSNSSNTKNNSLNNTILKPKKRKSNSVYIKKKTNDIFRLRRCSSLQSNKNSNNNIIQSKKENNIFCIVPYKIIYNSEKIND
jgi:hypothetical protein